MKKDLIKEAFNGLVKVIKALTKCKFKLRCCFESSCNTPDTDEKNINSINI